MWYTPVIWWLRSVFGFKGLVKEFDKICCNASRMRAKITRFTCFYYQCGLSLFQFINTLKFVIKKGGGTRPCETLATL